jgi:hypothetical protein
MKLSYKVLLSFQWGFLVLRCVVVPRAEGGLLQESEVPTVAVVSFRDNCELVITMDFFLKAFLTEACRNSVGLAV